MTMEIYGGRTVLSKKQIPFFAEVEWIAHWGDTTYRHINGEKEAKEIAVGKTGIDYGVVVKKTGLYFPVFPSNELEEI